MRPRTTEYDAWDPGLESELPREYLPLSTVFRSENVSTSVAKAHELSEYCGLSAHELVQPSESYDSAADGGTRVR